MRLFEQLLWNLAKVVNEAYGGILFEWIINAAMEY